jgi:hypothetical protein
MSIELALLPIAISAIGAIANRKKPQAVAGNHAQNPIYRETRMKDPELLQFALQNCGCRSVVSGVKVDSAIESARIVFEPVEGNAFIAVFTGDISSIQADDFLADVFMEYTRQVQQQVYRKLMNSATTKGMTLDAEELQDDDSIVLTFSFSD